MANQPTGKTRAGSVTVTTWTNILKTKDGREFPKSNHVPTRSYKDNEGQWQNVNSYDTKHLPELIAALTETYKNAMLTSKTEEELENLPPK